MFERSCADGAGPDESGELRGFAGDVVWAYLVARQERLPEALAELRVCEQLRLYEPLLRTHAAETFAAIFPDGIAPDEPPVEAIDESAIDRYLATSYESPELVPLLALCPCA